MDRETAAVVISRVLCDQTPENLRKAIIIAIGALMNGEQYWRPLGSEEDKSCET